MLIKLLAAGLGLAAITAGGVLGWSGAAVVLAPLVGVGGHSSELAGEPIELLQRQLQSSPELQVRQTQEGLQVRTQELPFPTGLGTGAGAWCRAACPCAIGGCRHSQGSLPRSGADATLPRLHSPLQRETRMAAVVQAWAAVQAFHPWQEQLQADQQLSAALQHSAEKVETGDSLGLLFAPLQDGHAMVYAAQRSRPASAALAVAADHQGAGDHRRLAHGWRWCSAWLPGAELERCAH